MIDFRFHIDLWNGIHYCLHCLASEKEVDCLLSREPAHTTNVHCQVYYSFHCEVLSFSYPLIHTPILMYLFPSSVHWSIHWSILWSIHSSIHLNQNIGLTVSGVYLVNSSLSPFQVPSSPSLASTELGHCLPCYGDWGLGGGCTERDQ